MVEDLILVSCSSCCVISHSHRGFRGCVKTLISLRSDCPNGLRPSAQGCRFGYPGRTERLVLQPQRGCACLADFPMRMMQPPLSVTRLSYHHQSRLASRTRASIREL